MTIFLSSIILIFLICLLMAISMGIIWALNTLFLLYIPITFWTILAMVILLLSLHGVRVRVTRR